MKKQLTVFGFSVLIVTAIAFIAFTPQERNKNNEKKQQQNQGKKEVKGNQGNKDVKVNQGNNDNKDPNMKNDNGKGNQGNKDGNMNKNNKGRDYGYEWNRVTFKDRRKFKNQDKVSVCHKFNRNNDPGVNISVSSNALKAHLGHGDIMGNCPVLSNSLFSDIFLRSRTDYYNQIQVGQEQLIYSQSILDYALDRLTESRAQLVVYQNSGMPQTVIVEKQATVVVLERNVSLLEVVVGEVANLLVNKLL